MATDGREILAPLGVGCHPDHLAVSDLAARLGCKIFWEDVAFWGIYGSSVEDRMRICEVSQRDLQSFVIVVVPIDADAKINALDCYPSQSRDTWRPIRYAAVVGREHGVGGLAERLFVHRSALDVAARVLKSRMETCGTVRYGSLPFDSFLATASS